MPRIEGPGGPSWEEPKIKQSSLSPLESKTYRCFSGNFSIEEEDFSLKGKDIQRSFSPDYSSIAKQNINTQLPSTSLNISFSNDSPMQLSFDDYTDKESRISEESLEPNQVLQDCVGDQSWVEGCFTEINRDSKKLGDDEECMKPTHLSGGGGCSGSYYILDENQEKIAIFKPQREEGGAEYGRNKYQVTTKEGIKPGTGAIREVLAHRLHEEIVPPTALVTIQSSQFSASNGRKITESGSLQKFVPNSRTFYKLSKEEKNNLDYQGIAYKDFITANADGHADNLLVDNQNRVISIDNGCILPDDCASAPTYCWLSYVDESEMFSQEMQEKANAIDLENEKELIIDSGLSGKAVNTRAVSVLLMQNLSDITTIRDMVSYQLAGSSGSGFMTEDSISRNIIRIADERDVDTDPDIKEERGISLDVLREVVEEVTNFTEVRKEEVSAYLDEQNLGSDLDKVIYGNNINQQKTHVVYQTVREVLDERQHWNDWQEEVDKRIEKKIDARIKALNTS
ncbi:MAG: hypothetical protein FJZ56_04805 [Chlamydiae bacterium]|nr:hypothetical protein [Chlamydiota bacterium]